MILDAIRKAIAASGQTRYAIAVACEIDHTVMHRIWHGGSCSLQTAERLLEYLNLTVVPRSGKRKGAQNG